MKKLLLVSLILLFLFGCKTTKMTEGLYFEQVSYQVSKRGDTTIINQKLYLIPNKFRSDFKTPYNESYTIVRLDQNLMYRLSPEESLYTEITFDAIKKQQERTRESIRRMRAQMDTLPPSLRWRMERDMGVKWQPEDYKILDTDETTQIAGYNCKKYIVMNRDSLDSEFWLTQDLGDINQYAGNWVEILDKITSVTKIDKYKLLSEKGIIMQSNVKSNKTIVTKLEKKLLPEDLFDVPEYYKNIKQLRTEQAEEEQSEKSE